jgi:hypothetical protein
MSVEDSTGQPSNTKAAPRFAFMDATEAAANLQTDRLTVLKYIAEGRLRTFGGKSGNPFLRSEDVLKLAAELQVATTVEATPDPKLVHRNDPVRKIRLRMQQDAKWPEIDEAAMRAWVGELDPISYSRMRQVALVAISQLQQVVSILDEASFSQDNNPEKPKHPIGIKING